MVPDWPTDIFSKKLPDGRYEISMAGVAPAVISPGLSRTRTNYQCWQILRLLDVYVKWFARQHGLRLPVRTGRFVECGKVFVFEAEDDPYTFAPRRIVVSREAG